MIEACDPDISPTDGQKTSISTSESCTLEKGAWSRVETDSDDTDDVTSNTSLTVSTKELHDQPLPPQYSIPFSTQDCVIEN